MMFGIFGGCGRSWWIAKFSIHCIPLASTPFLPQKKILHAKHMSIYVCTYLHSYLFHKSTHSNGSGQNAFEHGLLDAQYFSTLRAAVACPHCVPFECGGNGKLFPSNLLSVNVWWQWWWKKNGWEWKNCRIKIYYYFLFCLFIECCWWHFMNNLYHYVYPFVYMNFMSCCRNGTLSHR